MKYSLIKLRLYTIYSGMKQRFYNSENSNYEENGITICEEWLGDNGYNENLTIDRIDSRKGYSPDNCQYNHGKKISLLDEMVKDLGVKQ